MTYQEKITKYLALKTYITSTELQEAIDYYTIADHNFVQQWPDEDAKYVWETLKSTKVFNADYDRTCPYCILYKYYEMSVLCVACKQYTSYPENIGRTVMLPLTDEHYLSMIQEVETTKE